ncbi:MAG: tetratricopeptide repeat protein [Nitrospirales bacterium]
MAADKQAIQSKAQQLVARGQVDEAIAEWEKLLTNSPSDAAVHNTIGDLHLRRNANPAAIEAYLKAAQAFQTGGATPKAVAIYKKILKIDPNRYQVYQLLGDMNAERGLVSNAVADYQMLANLLAKAGKGKDAIEVLGKILTLDASNLAAKQRLAGVYEQEHLKGEALRTYLELGQAHAAQQQLGQAKKAYEAALRLQPSRQELVALVLDPTGAPPDPSILVEAGTGGSPPVEAAPAPSDGGPLDRAVVHIESGQYEQAENILNDLLSQEPGSPVVCRLLARLHLRQGLLSLAITEFQFLADAAMRAEDYAVAEALIKEYLDVHPDSGPLLELLGTVYERKGDGLSAVAQYGKALEVVIANPDPDLPTLPAELYEKIRGLAPGSPLVSRFFERFEPEGQAENQPAAADAPATAASRATESGRPVTVRSGRDARPAFQTHLELGGAYKQMGLLPEAIDELNIAAQAADCFVDSSVLLAGCLADEGQTEQAIQALEQVLGDARCDGDRAGSVRYGLGVLYEQAGRCDQAVQMYTAIPTVRDVAQRLARLTGKPPNGSANRPHAAPVASMPESSRKDAKPPPERKKRRISFM